jgi:CRISPR/Cas system-associated protein Cas5 (RAMP superfamily)
MSKKDMYDIGDAKTIEDVYIKTNERSEWAYLDEPLILEGTKYTKIDNIKRYILFKKKKSKFLVQLYEEELLSESDYWHLREWYYWKKIFNTTEEENERILTEWKEREEKKKIKI